MSTPVSPKLGGWDFAHRERELFKTAQQLPTWRLVDQSRRLLAAVLHELSNAFVAPAVTLTDELEANDANQLACLDLSAVVVRTTGSIIVLVGCGYEREAMAPGRTLVEAVIRGREVSEDPSGNK